MTDDPEHRGERSEALVRALREAEDEIRDLPYEVAYIIDRSGTVVTRREGEHNFVGLPAELMRDRIVTHNHPRGTSFSVEDVRTLIGTHALEMRVVSNRREFSLGRPADSEWEDVESLVNDVYVRVRRELLGQVRTGAISEATASRDILHLVWREIAEIRGWDYRWTIPQ
jgi:hypothetical protein